MTKVTGQSMEEALEFADQEIKKQVDAVQNIAEKNLIRVLSAFRAEKIGQYHFAPTSGYGYNDSGRDKLEDLYARIFHAEAALVRQQMVSGTHAIALALFGNLLPGDELVTLGMPYDTLQTIIGVKEAAPCTLKEMGITHRVVDIDFSAPDIARIVPGISKKTKMVSIQRSRGYSWRNSLSVDVIGQITQAIKEAYPHVIVFVDNCYGEFVEEMEPTDVGVDLLAGSLIKNLGAGIAPGGGYVVGKKELVDRAAYRLTVPGAGREMGASLTSNRLFYQALFLAPQIVAEAVLGSIFSSFFLQQLSFIVSPLPQEVRHDLILAIQLGTPEKLIAFCQGIQKYSPIDSFALPEPWPMPGYDHDIIMASGSFIQGSSIELSADGPLREPYIAYLQGGLTRHHCKYAICKTIEDMVEQNLI